MYACYSYQMQDWDGKLLAEANAKKHTLPSFFPITYHYPIPRDWDSVSKVLMLTVLITSRFLGLVSFLNICHRLITKFLPCFLLDSWSWWM